MTCPAAMAPASASKSPRSQPKWAAAGPTTREASVTRPVTTTSAPASRQAAMPQPAGQIGDGPGESGRVQSASVRDDSYARVQRQAEAVLKLAQEGPGVAEVGVLQPVPAQNEHGELGQVVAGQDVQLAAFEHLSHGGEPVAVEAGRVADPD